MKKYNLLLCGLIAMLFSACTKDELTETNSQPSGEIVSVTAYAAGSGEDTRVSYTAQGDGSYTLAWEETESFSVIRERYNETFSKTTAGNTFTGTLPDGDGDYYAVYPANASTSTQVPYDLSVQKGVLDSEKTLMYASSEDGTEFQFHHSTAILKATFSGLPNEATIKSVVVTTAEANLKGTQNLTNGKLTSDSSSQQITINFDEAVAANTPVFIYLPPMAANKKALTFHVTTNNGVYAASLAGDGGKAIEAGNIYNATVAVSKVESYLTFEADKDGMQLKLDDNAGSFLSSKGSDNKDRVFQYSTNGTHWTKITKDTGFIPFVNKKLYLRGQSIDGTWQSDNDYKYLKIQLSDKNSDNTNKVSCTGDIRTLVDYTKFATVSTDNARFRNLFDGCSALKAAPALPATKLAVKCYQSMFSGCTSLVNAPELPATTLADYCYNHMFNTCTALTVAPKLPATTLAANCYERMFSSCSALVNAPVLPATTLAANCYQYMFYYCLALVNAPELPATTLAANCYTAMFINCTALVNAPALPATTLAQSCYYMMFSGCTSLVNAPELPAETLTYMCYQQMFYNCSNLRTVTMLATDISASYCLNNWLYGVPTTPAGGPLTFYKNKDMKVGDGGIPQNSPSGIPSSHWIVTNYNE